MRNLVGRAGNVKKRLEKLVIIDPRCIHEGQAHTHAPTRAGVVVDRNVEQIEIIDHLRVLGLALDLLSGADKMPKRVLIPISHRDRPNGRQRTALRLLSDLAFCCCGSEVLHNPPITGALDLAATQPWPDAREEVIVTNAMKRNAMPCHGRLFN